MKKEDLKNKWWYRLVKVAYIAMAILISLGAIMAAHEETLPYLSTYESKYEFVCNDGTHHGEFTGDKLNTRQTDFEVYDPQSLLVARIICNGRSLSQSDLKDIQTILISRFGSDTTKQSGVSVIEQNYGVTISSSRNYEIVLKKPVYSSTWIEYLTVMALVIFGLLVVFSLVRAVFLYVVIGEKFWGTLMLRKKNI